MCGFRHLIPVCDAHFLQMPASRQATSHLDPFQTPANLK
ncbi:hypothetical protein DESC_810173 [Desulfosarcina cetonica]|nr:hypothetical protein DESC_810173 [Desulfosarcina cetonica]